MVQKDGPTNESGDCLVSVGCDYLTVTAPESKQLDCLHSYATSLFQHQADLGNTPKAWGMSGFTGWRCGSVQIGTSIDSVLVRLSSDSAFHGWREAFRRSTNCSRLDLQATIKRVDGPTQAIESNRLQALTHSAKHNDKPIVRWVQDQRGGYTLYLGARTSVCFGRIYDKFQESKMPFYDGCVRYEVQYHNRLARLIGNTLSREDSPRATICGHINRFFEQRELELNLAGYPQLRLSSPRRRSDDDKALQWLRSQARSSVLRLIRNGRGEELFEALGLVDNAIDEDDGPSGTNDD